MLRSYPTGSPCTNWSHVDYPDMEVFMTIDPKDNRLFTVPQTQAMLGIGRTTLWNMIASGEIESVRIGRSRRIPAEAIDRYVEGLRAKDG